MKYFKSGNFIKSIRFKLMAIIVSFFLVICLSLFVAMSFFTEQKIKSLEENEAILQLEKVRGLMQYELYHLHTIVGDWSYWDETANFISVPNQAYIDENLTIETLENLNVDMMIYLDDMHQVVHSIFYDFQSGMVRTDTVIIDDIVLFHHSRFDGTHEEFQGVMHIEEQLILISSRVILPTDLSGDALGHLVFVRIYDAHEIQIVEDIFSFEFNIIPYFEMEHDTYQVDMINPQELIIYGSIETMNEGESIIISLRLPRTNYSILTEVNELMLFTLVFGSMILTFVLFILLRRNFTDRIEDMVAELKGYQINEKFRFLRKNNSKDEIYLLQTEMNTFISQIERKNAHIHELAYIDPVTGCANRNQLFEHIEHAIAAVNDHQPLWLLHFDLDYFAHINTLYGYEVGDDYIKLIAQKLKAIVKSDGLVSRIYADQFLIFISGKDEDSIKVMAQEMIDTMNDDTEVSNEHISSHASIGIVRYAQYAQTPVEMAQRAYEALVNAELMGRNQYYIYDENLHLSIIKKSKIFSHLKSAIKLNQFYLVYQPQVDMNSKRIIGFEALIRWNHPEMGFISPLDFIGIAESQGYINDIGTWVLETACTQMKALFHHTGKTWPFSVNVSGYQFNQGKIIAQVKNALNQSGLTPSLLELEITESTFMSWGKEELDMLEQLRHMGVVISMDDFGTGYSSLAQIQDIHCDIIKLDSKFIWGIGNVKTEKIITHVLRLTKELGYTVIAEGVETSTQEAFLIANQCRLAQGYYYYKPLKFEQLLELMAETNESVD